MFCWAVVQGQIRKSFECFLSMWGMRCRDATLKLTDLQRNNTADPDAVYRVIYSGRGSMPGYGLECAPKLQCTFAKRLSDDEIRQLAAYVLDQAAADWPTAAQ
jgi:cytochrome c6